MAAQCSIQTKSVERVFRGERTTLKTAQEIAAALKCKPEKLFHIELDHRPIARKTIKEYAIFLRLVRQYAEREYGIDNEDVYKRQVSRCWFAMTTQPFAKKWPIWCAEISRKTVAALR